METRQVAAGVPDAASPRWSGFRGVCGRVVLLVLASLPAVTGCDATDDDPEPPLVPVTIQDSAGVAVVENHAPRWRDRVVWRIEAEPILEIGAVEGEEPVQFQRVAGATRLEDGRIVVVEGRSYEIRIFDAAGGHLVSFGGEGDGPGEFRAPPSVLPLAGDTLLVFDVGAFRYSWFTLDGRLVTDEAFSRERAIGNVGLVASDRRVLLPDGAFFHVGLFPPSNVEAFETDDGITAYAPIPHEITRHDMRLGFVGFRGPEDRVFGRFPFRESGYVPGEDGWPALEVTNDYHAPTLVAFEREPARLHLSTGGRREIRTLDRSGELVRIIRQTTPLEPIVAPDLRARREAVRRAAREAGVDTRDALALFDRIEFPDSVFPFAALEADPDGNLWALEHRGTAEDSAAVSFVVFDADGVWLGRVPGPHDLGEILEVGGDYVLTEWRNPVGVPFVRLHAIGGRSPSYGRTPE